MKKICAFSILVLLLSIFVLSSGAYGGATFLYEQNGMRYYEGHDGRIIIGRQFGVPKLLTSSPDYDWWYGCSPTSAGMMMGYYDINGYGGLAYPNLVPGGEAELSTFGNPGAIANDTIASQAHIDDFYVTFGHPGPDACNNADPTTCHDFDCLADFMGTSQAQLGSTDGNTWFYTFNDGSPFTPADAEANGLEDESGMYGVREYVQYAGYNVDTIYHQPVYPVHASGAGFTAAQYRAEIDAGRPVLINIEGHSMFGYGYDYDSIEQMTTVYVHDTWNPGDDHTFTWGGNYDGRQHLSVMPLTVSGGDEEECDYCLEDAFGYVWCLNEIKRDGLGIYLNGDCDASGDDKDALALYRWANGALTMTAYGGNGVVFTYNGGLGNTSMWVNSWGGTGTVVVDYCDSVQAADSPSDGAAPNDAE
ncbi:hypothetical protein DSCA_20230 [Desulfosarcina alkanivorans]|uniref:Peptidase C39-like domain-containing protein n=1 Tax=Desulfosarcina alkanivorans TaxID=571177 RepID=A0A5K7YHQ0_9BACT|nr:hypothetical protein [Desulfosarcina alkanivorans]BBO68093.1 hypothetical protein DSCA_20230 [Desulfosarcina alkanivorans]